MMKDNMIDEQARLTDPHWGEGMRVHRVIDAKLPLTWLITSAVAIVGALVTLEWSVAAQNNKLEQLITQYGKIETRLDQRDQRIDQLVQQFYEMQRVDDAQSLRIDRIEQTMGINQSTNRKGNR